MAKLILYGAPTSSCSFRVRIALALKGLCYEDVCLPTTSTRRAEDFTQLNPQRLVPFFIDDKVKIGQSIAIMEYLEETYPENPLLPTDRIGRARVRSLAQYVVSEIQPLQNTRLNPYLAEQGVDDFEWAQHWVRYGLDHLEADLSSPATGRFCHGDAPTMADACLVPQLWNAVHRYATPLEPYKRLSAIWDNCVKLEAFKTAMPERQPGFQKPSGPVSK